MRFYKTGLFLLAISLTILAGSCSYNSREVEPAGSCETENVTLSGTVQPILDKNCIVCHSGPSPANGLDYTKYSDVMMVALNGKLVGAINHLDGYYPMPKNAPKLPDCDIAKIEAWVNNGALND